MNLVLLFVFAVWEFSTATSCRGVEQKMEENCIGNLGNILDGFHCLYCFTIGMMVFINSMSFSSLYLSQIFSPLHHWSTVNG